MTVLTRPDGIALADLHLSRRAALVAAGYAAFAAGAEAAPITTPADGLIVESATMAGGLPGYVARPTGKGRHPAVIVVNEVFGLHEYIKDTCRRLARLGYVVLAPEFFFRADPNRSLATLTDFPAIMKIVGTAGYEQVMGDVSASLDWLAAQPFVAPQRLAITGFCWGGNIVWLAAARFPQLRAGTAWYGRLVPPAGGNPDGRPWPIDLATSLKAPVLGLYGALDKGIPVADVERMQAALQGTASSIVLYPDADHGFHADYRPSYNEAAAQDGWKRMLAHFRTHGV